MKETIASQVYTGVLGGMADHLQGYWDVWDLNKKYIPSKSNVFEVGSGNGEVCSLIKEKDNYVVGSDISEASVITVDKRANEAIRLDISEEIIPFENNEFDFVMCFEVLEHISNPYHAIKEMKRVCRDNGYIHISIPDYDQQFGYSSHQHAFVYPGLFQLNNFRKFLIQMYLFPEVEQSFRHATTFTVEEDKNYNFKRRTGSLHHYFICRNIVTDVDIIKVINGDYESEALYPFAKE